MVNLTLLNCPVRLFSGWEEATAEIKRWLSTDGQHQLVTINPEFVLAAKSNEEFKTVLTSNPAVADGIGVVWAAHYLKPHTANKSFGRYLRWFVTGLKLLFKPSLVKDVIIDRVTGVDLTVWLCQEITAKVYFLGGLNDTAELARQKVLQVYPGANIVGAEAGPSFIDQPTPADQQNLLNKINNSNANVLLVGWGAPKQDLWITRHLKELPTIKLALGVGGTFDYLAGQTKRAPLFLRQLSLEWLWRLGHQPRRWKRIINALSFSLLVAKNR